MWGSDFLVTLAGEPGQPFHGLLAGGEVCLWDAAVPAHPRAVYPVGARNTDGSDGGPRSLFRRVLPGLWRRVDAVNLHKQLKTMPSAQRFCCIDSFLHVGELNSCISGPDQMQDAVSAQTHRPFATFKTDFSHDSTIHQA